jgi:hypothetical protein
MDDRFGHSPDGCRLHRFVPGKVKLAGDTAHWFQSVRDQRSEIRRRPKDEGGRITDHASEHCTNFMTLFGEDCMIAFRQIAAVMGEVEPSFSLTVFAICVGQLTYKMSFVPTFCPCFSEICTNRPGGSPNLVDK